LSSNNNQEAAMSFAKAKLSDEALETVAMLFRSLGEVMRLRILRMLEEREMTVGELAAAVRTSQANVSKHLKTLINAGVLARRSQGTAAYYSIGDPMILKICDTICSGMTERMKTRAAGFGLKIRN
jgi:DNA-binding transcriptional ArsR family regulator